MKFGKELKSQMVPEWQEAYMDYIDLKNLLKEISQYRQQNISIQEPVVTPRRSVQRSHTLYRAFSGLNHRHDTLKSYSRKVKEDEAILMQTVPEEEGSEDSYRTIFLMSTEEGGDKELKFFERLDMEFNKVVRFYKGKVSEVTKTADKLSRQMDALIALRVKVDYPMADLESAGGYSSCSPAPSGWKRLAKAHARGKLKNALSGSFNGRKEARSLIDVVEEIFDMKDEIQQENRKHSNTNKAEKRNFSPASVDVLNHVKINVTAETPVLTLRNVLTNSNADSSFSKDKLLTVEKKMKRAFIEFHQELRLLKSYCYMNQLAFSKIMKKYDKITKRHASKTYLEMVDQSYLGSSDEVTRLIERVEATFIKHFYDENREAAMGVLRPLVTKQKHTVTFFIGFFSGCSIALIVAIILILHLNNLYKSEGRHQYMENVFPLYSLFGFIVLHMLLFSGNIYCWRRFRVNYSFIFGFKPGSELSFRDVLLLSLFIALLTLAAVLSNLDMDIEPRTRKFSTITELVPVGLLVVLLLITLCPYNIFYHEYRFFFVNCVWRCLCAPLYKVTLPDFFLGDQLTSQVQSFRSLEFYICYYGWGDFTRRTHNCRDSNAYQMFYIIVAIIPYMCRLLQCLRRFFDEEDHHQAQNALKYFSTIVAVVLRTFYDQKKGMVLKILATLASLVSTIFNTYWDLVNDWGLLRKNSRNPYLRDKLLLPNKSVYFIAMVVNVILRLAWMQTVLDINETAYLHKKALVAVVTCMEITRRGIWNFFRLENEHLNNVGKFRAFKSVPLPFNYEDKDL